MMKNVGKLFLLVVFAHIGNMVAYGSTNITATLDHTGSTYYDQGETYTQTCDAEGEHYNSAQGRVGWNGQAAIRFSFTIPEGKTVTSATLTWSTYVYGPNSVRSNILKYMNIGKDLDWTAFVNGTAGMIAATKGTPFTQITDVQLEGGTSHNGIETDVTAALQAVESQGYVTFIITGNPAGGLLSGKASENAPSLSITCVDKYTVTFSPGDDASCDTESLSCLGEGDNTTVTLPTATDDNGATFMGWYTAAMGGTRIGGAGDTYTPTADITLYAQYNRAPTAIVISGESSVYYGGTTTLTATISPSNTVNSGISWASSDKSVATIDANGVITTRSAGTTVITARATADEENIRDVFNFTVESEDYGYTVNAVDGDGNILKTLATGTYKTGTGNTHVAIPKYVLSGTTLYETEKKTGNYYNYYFVPDCDGYVTNREYTYSTVNNVVYYSEAEHCSAFDIKVNNSTTDVSASNDTIARNSAYSTVTTLVPGTYIIHTSAINGNKNAFSYKFKAGGNVVMDVSVATENNIGGVSEAFTLTEAQELSVYCPAGNAGGLDYFYIVQDDTYHVITNAQKFAFTEDNVENTVYTTADAKNQLGKGMHGTYDDVTGYFYNIKDETNYVTIKEDGAIAFYFNARHGNSKDTRLMHVYVDNTKVATVDIVPGTFTSSSMIPTGSTGTHVIKITGDDGDVYPIDIYFYNEKVAPTLATTATTMKVGETVDIAMSASSGCSITNLVSNSDATVATATYTAGQLTLQALKVGSTTLTFNITGDGTVFNDATATFTVDVLKSGLTLAFTDGDAGEEATVYVCNAEEETPALPNVSLTATDENGNSVNLSELTLTYSSDDATVATVTSTGVVTLTQPYGNGTAVIKAVATSSNYDDAEAEYTITIQKGVNWKTAEHPKFADTAPAVRDTFHVYKMVGDEKKLYLVGTFGGWNRNSNTYNYPKPGGTSSPKTDSWGELTSSYASVDGFSMYRSGNNDASNESMYSSLEQYYNDVIYGVERFGWFKQPDNGTVHPFTLPVRGAYVTLEPTVNGTLSVYIEQNGSWNSGKKDIYDNDGNLVSQYNGSAYSFPGIAPFQFRPHAFFIVDENGNLVDNYTDVNMITRTAVTSGIATTGTDSKQEAMLDEFCENYGCERGEKFKCIIDESVDGYSDVTNIGNWTEFKEYMSAEEQQRVCDNWSAGVNGAQKITKLDNGAYLAIDKGMVKYTFHVVAGQTYYVFSNFSKIGFAGCNFVPDADEYQPSGTLELSETVAYNPEDLQDPIGENTVPMYETITLDRSFTTGKWNTVCLPFTMTESEVETVFGKGTELIILDRVTVDEGHAQIFMTYHEIQSILAGYPYLIKPTQNVAHIEVNNKAIDPQQSVLQFTNGGYTSKGVDGFCNPQTYASALTGMSQDITASAYLKTGDIYLANNTLYISRGKSFLKGYRTYLYKEDDAPEAKTVSFGYYNAWEDEEDITLIDVSEITEDAQDNLELPKTLSGVYNLNGQKIADRLEGLPKGLYIANGRKVVVK